MNIEQIIKNIEIQQNEIHHNKALLNSKENRLIDIKVKLLRKMKKNSLHPKHYLL